MEHRFIPVKPHSSFKMGLKTSVGNIIPARVWYWNKNDENRVMEVE
jgi:hypothetical protein